MNDADARRRLKDLQERYKRSATLAKRREGPLQLFLRLYRQDQTFRGFLDFAAIGVVVLLFLNPPPLLDAARAVWSFATAWSSPTAPSSESRPFQIAGTGPAANGNSSNTLSDLMATSYAQMFPRRPEPFGMVIDESAFESSAPDQRARLRTAAATLQARNSRGALVQLAGLDVNDPNVMLIRGMATIAAAGTDAVATGTRLLREAAARGQRQANAYLGLMLIVAPLGAPRHPQEGRRLLEMAADAGDASAARLLGYGYHFGWTGTIDNSRAVRYLRLAAERGESDCWYMLALLASRGIGMERDPALAESFLRAAAERGHAISQLYLGLYYSSQYLTGWITDGAPVVEWLSRAASHGLPQAQFGLAMFHLRGAREPPWQDTRRGIEVLRDCTARLHGACLELYAQVLENGIGVEPNRVAAYAYYMLARDRGESSASAAIARLERALTPAERETAQRTASTIKGIPARPASNTALGSGPAAGAPRGGCGIAGLQVDCNLRPDPSVPVFSRVPAQ